MDKIDLDILATLQHDASLTNIDLAERVNLSPAPCLRRVQKLRQAGVLERITYTLNRNSLGLGIMAFVNLRANVETEKELTTLRRKVEEIPEVLGFFRTSGDTDYIMLVVTRDMESYNRLYKDLIGLMGVYSITTNFVMEEFKFTLELPLHTFVPEI